MEVTINLPEGILANLASMANRSHRRVDEVIAEKIERDFAIDTETLATQIAACSDSELRELSKVRMPADEDLCLSSLLQLQNERELTEAERRELWKLMELNRLVTLKKAYALREVSRRGLNGQN